MDQVQETDTREEDEKGDRKSDERERERESGSLSACHSGIRTGPQFTGNEQGFDDGQKKRARERKLPVSNESIASHSYSLVFWMPGMR